MPLLLPLPSPRALAGLAAANNSYTTKPTTKPTAKPTTTCNVCWEWTLSGCKDSYYKGDMCNTAVHKLQYVLDDIGYARESVHGPCMQGLQASSCQGPAASLACRQRQMLVCTLTSY